MQIARVVAIALVAGCAFDLPQIDNPFRDAASSLIVSPSEMPIGVHELVVTDERRDLDFRTIWDVDDLGDFVVLDWSSNGERLWVEIDVFDDALGEQDLVLQFENDDELLVPFLVR